MIELKNGEKRAINGITIECVVVDQRNGCVGCVYRDLSCYGCGGMVCNGKARKDGKNVIFKKVEKGGGCIRALDQEGGEEMIYFEELEKFIAGTTYFDVFGSIPNDSFCFKHCGLYASKFCNPFSTDLFQIYLVKSETIKIKVIGKLDSMATCGNDGDTLYVMWTEGILEIKKEKSK